MSGVTIVAISRRIVAWYRECVEYNGLLGRLASIRSLGEPLRDIGSVQTDYARQLRKRVGRAERARSGINERPPICYGLRRNAGAGAADRTSPLSGLNSSRISKALGSIFTRCRLVA